MARKSNLMSLAAVLLLAQTTLAHFQLKYPDPLGAFKDDDEGTAPCGGYTPDFAKQNITKFHVGGESIALLSGHPQTNWLFRVTSDQTASGNWSQIFPIVQQSGLGSFCEPVVTVDSSWVGKNAVLGVVANGPDGMLYQCAAVSFIEGKGTTPGSCTNSSSVTGAFTSDSSLTAMVSNTGSSSSSNSTGSSTTSATASGTSSSSTATTKPNAAGTLRVMDSLPMISSILVAYALMRL